MCLTENSTLECAGSNSHVPAGASVVVRVATIHLHVSEWSGQPCATCPPSAVGREDAALRLRTPPRNRSQMGLRAMRNPCATASPRRARRNSARLDRVLGEITGQSCDFGRADLGRGGSGTGTASGITEASLFRERGAMEPTRCGLTVDTREGPVSNGCSSRLKIIRTGPACRSRRSMPSQSARGEVVGSRGVRSHQVADPSPALRGRRGIEDVKHMMDDAASVPVHAEPALTSAGIARAGRIVASSGDAMPTITSTADDGHEDPGPRTIIVQGSATGFAHQIAMGQHRLTADEPLSVGGNDRSPAAYDRLLAAPGSCTSFGVRQHARAESISKRPY